MPASLSSEIKIPKGLGIRNLHFLNSLPAGIQRIRLLSGSIRQETGAKPKKMVISTACILAPLLLIAHSSEGKGGNQSSA
jgi:hypothetical protein